MMFDDPIEEIMDYFDLSLSEARMIMEDRHKLYIMSYLCQTKNDKEFYENDESGLVDSLLYNINFSIDNIFKPVLTDMDDNVDLIDYGCGCGTFSLMASDRGHNVVSVDYTPKITFTDWRADRYDKKLETMHIYEYYHKADAVVAFDVLEHTDIDDTINRIKRFLSNNGIFYEFSAFSAVNENQPMHKKSNKKYSDFDKWIKYMDRNGFELTDKVERVNKWRLKDE